ncbi:hypothetical protein MCL36_16695 [Acinetobacter pittii]|uniref:hypothetical protein n=1 Tax=Acinetobacter calcoaceticus/baumannii complex TaxID=909768 RepID=UPI001EFCC521|nr:MULTISPECIES: hypothetical protein [Acinetobacter calcoaceticus/baumannii complex]MCG9494166.1 hypothetical protein [Acinetobacter pittii]MCU4347747.1 hypothetical protein [Acinetobacter lactucae]
MGDWKCSKCGHYILVNHYKIKVGEIVEFKTTELTHHDQTYKKGVVILKNKNILFINCKKKLYKIDCLKAYPATAPTFFIYNMFGACNC